MEPKEKWLLKAAEAEGNGIVSVGGLAAKMALLDRQERLAERAALGKLVELRRREKGLSVAELAAQAKVTIGDVVSIEWGVTGVTTPEVLGALSRLLNLPVEKLLGLAGFNGDSDPAIQDAAVRFAAQASPAEKLSPTEHAALTSFVEVLTESK